MSCTVMKKDEKDKKSGGYVDTFGDPPKDEKKDEGQVSATEVVCLIRQA